jgi:hypothetical protein
MTSGAWFVLFPKARMPSKGAVMSTLNEIGDATDQGELNPGVLKPGEMEFSVTVPGGTFHVALNTLSYVLIETHTAVARDRKSLDHPEEVETYDARFELLFDYRDIGDLFNPLLAAAERLAELTSGVVYESNNGVFQ